MAEMTHRGQIVAWTGVHCTDSSGHATCYIRVSGSANSIGYGSGHERYAGSIKSAQARKEAPMTTFTIILTVLGLVEAFSHHRQMALCSQAQRARSAKAK